MRIRRAVPLVVAAFSIGATPSSPDTVRIAHPNLSAFISTQDGKTVGVVADVLRAAAAREGITIAFVPLAGDPAATLAAGSADAVAPMFVSPSGQKTFDFSATIVTTGGGLFVRSPGPAPSDAEMLAGKTVATPSFGPYLGFFARNFPSIKIVKTSSYAESIERVLSGEADAAALNFQDGAAFVAASYAGKIAVPTAMFVKTPLVLAVAKGTHSSMLERFDAGLAAIRADGTLQRIEDADGTPP
jgi:ABC-type amino acid transport substrate-binding protein